MMGAPTQRITTRKAREYMPLATKMRKLWVATNPISEITGDPAIGRQPLPQYQRMGPPWRRILFEMASRESGASPRDRALRRIYAAVGRGRRAYQPLRRKRRASIPNRPGPPDYPGLGIRGG